jgi:hypothetical protein
VTASVRSPSLQSSSAARIFCSTVFVRHHFPANLGKA